MQFRFKHPRWVLPTRVIPLKEIQERGGLLYEYLECAGITEDQAEPVEIEVLCSCDRKDSFELAFELSYMDSVDSWYHVRKLHKFRRDKALANDAIVLNTLDAVQWLGVHSVVRSFEDYMLVNRVLSSKVTHNKAFEEFERQLLLRIPVERFRRRKAQLSKAFDLSHRAERCPLSVGAWIAVRELIVPEKKLCIYDPMIPAKDIEHGWGFFYLNELTENPLEPPAERRLRECVFRTGNTKAMRLCNMNPIASEHVFLANSTNLEVLPMLRDMPRTYVHSAFVIALKASNMPVVEMFHRELNLLDSFVNQTLWHAIVEAGPVAWDFVKAVFADKSNGLLDRCVDCLIVNLLRLGWPDMIRHFLNTHSPRMLDIMPMLSPADQEHVMVPITAAENRAEGRYIAGDLLLRSISSKTLELLFRYSPHVFAHIDWSAVIEDRIVSTGPRRKDAPIEAYAHDEIIEFVVKFIHEYNVPFAVRLKLTQAINRMEDSLARDESIKRYRKSIGYFTDRRDFVVVEAEEAEAETEE